MKHRAVQRILDVKPYQPGRPIDEVKRDLGLSEVIKLASNENPFPPSPRVVQAIVDGIKDINRYPDGGCYYLRQVLAAHLGVNGAQLIFGNGSDEVIIMAIRAFVEPGDGIIVSHPSFAVYTIGAKIAGAQLTVVPMNSFRHDLTAVAGAVTERTKIIFLDNPGNPSGSFITERELRMFLNSVSRDVMVFLDEAYYEYGCRKPGYPQSIALLEDYPNLVIARTFSKMYGLAGLRIGYGIAATPMIEILDRVREPFNVNSLAQQAAIACLEDQEFYDKTLAVIDEEREKMGLDLDRLGLTVVPSATNFILADAHRPAAGLSEALQRRGVIVRDMTAWGLETFIRITIGRPEENQMCLSALREEWL